MDELCLMFPGQGSQKVGMGRELVLLSSFAKEVFECGSSVFGADLFRICCEYEQSGLSNSDLLQPAIVAVSVCGFYCLKERGIEARAFLGHSLGEYSALICSGIVSLEDGFKLLRARINCLRSCFKKDNSNHGVMCAIIGVDSNLVEQACKKVSGYVACANYNSPLQTVVAGETSAVNELVDELSSVARRCVFLKVPAAFHSKLMEPAALLFEKELEKFEFLNKDVKFYSNVTGEKVKNSKDFRVLLRRHLIQPILFKQELLNAKQDGFKIFVELGPGNVLSGLVKRTLKEVEIFNIEGGTGLVEFLKRAKSHS